ncbi:MAG: ABC transporter permease [Actinomycetota bacterium]
MTNVFVFAGRSARRFSRSPDTVVSTVIFPLLLLVTLHAVFSQAVEAFEDGAAYGQRLVPTLVFSGIMFGTIAIAAGVNTEVQDGWFDRIRSMPVSPAAPLAGAVIGDAVRAVIAVAVLVGVGHLFGFRFDNGVLPAVGFVAVAIVAAMTFTWMAIYFGVIAKSREALLGPLNAVFLLMLFLSRGMVPLDAYPGWAQPIVRANPATAYVTLLDRLARGGELVQPFLIAAGWTVAISGVFGSLAVRRIRTAGGRPPADSVAAPEPTPI